MYGDYRAGQTAHALSAQIPQGFPPEREQQARSTRVGIWGGGTRMTTRPFPHQLHR
jgi:hypothetical protein